LRAMQGLLAASGHYRDELIKNPCEYVATKYTVHLLNGLKNVIFKL